MSDSKIDYLNPYATLAQQHKDGLDAIITSIGAGGPGTVTLEDLTDAVYDYIVSVYTNFSSSPEGIGSLRTMIANAINGYIDNGGASPYLRTLQSVPVVALGNQFDRLFDASRAAPQIKGAAGRQQMVIALGQADADYWGNQILTSGSWTTYMNGNDAIDMMSVPYWVDAAMFGSQFDYYQVNGNDAQATTTVFSSALIGSLALAAGKVIFGWVPKNVGMSSAIISEDCHCTNTRPESLLTEMSGIGKPIATTQKAAKTNYHTPATGNHGRDLRWYANGSWCMRFFGGDLDGTTTGFGCDNSSPTS